MCADIKQVGNYVIHTIPQVEFANPLEFDFNNQLDMKLWYMQMMAAGQAELKDMSANDIHNFAVKEHLKSWKAHYKQTMAVQFPDNFFDFLQAEKRKKQHSILEKLTLDSKAMTAIFYRAFNEHNFTYSYYRFEKKSREFAGKQYPELYYQQADNSVDKIGKTDLSDAQLRASLAQRKVVIAKFLDNKSKWHCFLHTFNSILGREVGNKPHVHYISGAFGNHISREGVLNELRKVKYKLETMLHIPFSDDAFDHFPEVPVFKSGE